MEKKFLTVKQALEKQANFALMNPFSICFTSEITAKIILMQVKLDSLAQRILTEREAIVAKVTPKGYGELADKFLKMKDDPSWPESPDQKKFEKLSSELDTKFASIWEKRLEEFTDLIDEHFDRGEFTEFVSCLINASIKNEKGEEVKDKLIYYIAANFVD